MGQNASHEPLGPDLPRGSAAKDSSVTFHPLNVGSSIRKSLRKRRDKRQLRESQGKDSTNDPATTQVRVFVYVPGGLSFQIEGPFPRSRKMDKLKRTLSLRKKKDQNVPDDIKPHIWTADEASVKAGTCNFSVKYLGCVEVFESRGMQVCEEALKVLRTNKRRPIRGILYVSGDGLRVVDDDTKGLIVDQTIEKVSFCAPDRNHERGFSYICRDGTARRWMCHGFVASRDSGERLSHAVGCAFAACLERKQKRDQDSGVTMSFDNATSTFTRMGSFKQMTVTERLSDPQECKPSDNPLPLKKVENPHAIARPHATPLLLQRQGSFRVFNQLSETSPFKRQLSLRLSDLPSTLERTRLMTAKTCADNAGSQTITVNGSSSAESDSEELVRPQRNRLQSLPNAGLMAPIPESGPMAEGGPNAVSEMCQQVSAELSLLSSFSTDPFVHDVSGDKSLVPTDEVISDILHDGIDWSNRSKSREGNLIEDITACRSESALSKGEEWLAQLRAAPLSLTNPSVEQPLAQVRKNPPLSQLRSASVGTPPSKISNETLRTDGTSNVSNPQRSKPQDPFDAEWASIPSQNTNPNNPFIQSVTKAFEVKM